MDKIANQKFDPQPVNLKDELISLKPLSNNDFEDLYTVASDPLIWEQHPENDRYKRKVFKVFYDGAIKSGGAFLIIENCSNKIIGSTRYYDYDESKARITIGFTFLAREYWGGIYNSSLKKLMLDYAFKYVTSVIFHVGANNIRSQKAVLKLGAKRIEHQLSSVETNYQYVLSKRDYGI